MPAFSEVIYNPTEVLVAALQSGNTYGTPVAIDYMQKVSFETEADQDEIKSGGVIVEALAIPTKIAGELEVAALNLTQTATMLGYNAQTYGVDPNQYGVMDGIMGGQGLPYFGMLVRYQATLGGDLIVGFPKAMLETVPSFDVDQNKFRVGSANFNAYAPSTTRRAAYRFKKNQVGASLASQYATAGNFLAFFTTPPPSLFS
jgi:hypothetical protein